MSRLTTGFIATGLMATGVGLGVVGTNLYHDWQAAQVPEVPDRIVLADVSCDAIGQPEGVAEMLLETVHGFDDSGRPLVSIETTEIKTQHQRWSEPSLCVATRETTIGYINDLNFHEFPVMEGDQLVDLSGSFVTAITEVELERAIELLNSKPVELVSLRP